MLFVVAVTLSKRPEPEVVADVTEDLFQREAPMPSPRVSLSVVLMPAFKEVRHAATAGLTTSALTHDLIDTTKVPQADRPVTEVDSNISTCPFS